MGDKQTNERAKFLAYLGRQLRYKPEDEGDKLIIREIGDFVSAPRADMFFDFVAAEKAIREFRWERFGTPRLVDLAPVLDKCWRAARAAFRPRRYFDQLGRPAGERRCADCRGKGAIHRCAHVDGPWRSSNACRVCPGACSVCRNCQGGGYAADESLNENSPYVANSEAQTRELFASLRELAFGGPRWD
jgi:hypothetical protein